MSKHAAFPNPKWGRVFNNKLLALLAAVEVPEPGVHLGPGRNQTGPLLGHSQAPLDLVHFLLALGLWW